MVETMTTIDDPKHAVGNDLLKLADGDPAEPAARVPICLAPLDFLSPDGTIMVAKSADSIFR